MFMICLQGMTIADVAKTLYISHSTVERLVHLHRTTGVKHGPKKRLSDFEELTVLQSFLNCPGIYFREVQERFDVTGTWVSLCRTAKRLGLTRQKMKKYAIRRSEIHRGQYMAEIEAFDPEMVVFIDETGCDRRNSIRQLGYGIRGITSITHRLLIYGQRISAIGVMPTRGVEDVYQVEGNVNGDIFINFVQRCLLNVIQPFDETNPRSVIILDNAAIHHLDAVVALISAAGALVRFLPPYSPDLNPIEELFSKVKGYLKDNETAYQATLTPRVIVSSAFASVTPKDCQNYAKHAGYTQ